MTSRPITKIYQDPLDLIWTNTAKQLGMKLTRSSEVFAAWDGKETLTIGSPEDLDADDSLAQMIFHEICHAIVQGPGSMSQENWGLNNTDGRDDLREMACIRLQAALAENFGLKEFFAVTTDWRSYHDSLPSNPLTGDDDPALEIALEAHRRATSGPWAESISAALRATQTIVAAAYPFSNQDSLFTSFHQGA
ncbi:MAG: hypothetical protein HOI23_18105 [Deltaproteobacteria bacterium]|jgi:hypothetical protein|nr:hypothetical protein [Deltaproteobacteria bacterium]